MGIPVYCDTAIVTIYVAPVNDPPIANNDFTKSQPASRFLLKLLEMIRILMAHLFHRVLT